MDSSSSDAASEKDILGKRKQADSFKLSKLLGARGLWRWKKKLRKVIAKASGWPHECYDWMIVTEKDLGTESVRDFGGNIFNDLNPSG